MTKHLAMAMLMALAILLVKAPALAAEGAIKLTNRAETEVTTTDAKGNKKVSLVPVEMAKVVPGSTVLYTIIYKNVSKNPVKDAVIHDPVSAETTYIDGSAEGKDTAITFSVDKGKTFGKPKELFVTDADGKKRPAVAAEYTNIRWEVSKPIPPGKEGSVSFKAKVK